MANQKDFIKDNPAFQFISTTSEDTPTPTASTPAQIPAGYKLDPRYIEKRTQRVQLLLQPSLMKKAKAKAKKNKQSFNDYIHTLIEADINQ